MNKGLFGFRLPQPRLNCGVAFLSFLSVLRFPPTLKVCTLGWLENLNCTWVLKCDWYVPCSGLSLTQWPIIPSFMSTVCTCVLCWLPAGMQEEAYAADIILCGFYSSSLSFALLFRPLLHTRPGKVRLNNLTRKWFQPLSKLKLNIVWWSWQFLLAQSQYCRYKIVS